MSTVTRTVVAGNPSGVGAVVFLAGDDLPDWAVEVLRESAHPALDDERAEPDADVVSEPDSPQGKKSR